jgi:hypothetical protein
MTGNATLNAPMDLVADSAERITIAAGDAVDAVL